MAIIRLDCNLNGGDSVTPNNELFYRIYGDVDNYATPIHETGTALTDANVTVNNDNVIITGVDGDTNTTFKIAAVDGAGNEGILSDAVSGFVILLADTFQGTVINDTLWDVIDPPDSINITQDDNLLITMTSQANVGWGDNMLVSKVSAPGQQFAAVLNPISITGGENRERGFLLSSVGNTSIWIRGNETNLNTQTSAIDSDGTQIMAITDHAIQWEGKSWRILHKSNTLYFQYYDSGWVTLDSVATGGLIDSDLNIEIRSAGNNIDSAGGVITIGSAYITDDEFTNETPT